VFILTLAGADGRITLVSEEKGAAVLVDPRRCALRRSFSRVLENRFEARTAA